MQLAHTQRASKGHILRPYQSVFHKIRYDVKNLGLGVVVNPLRRESEKKVDFSGDSDVKESNCSAGDLDFDPWVGKIP